MNTLGCSVLAHVTFLCASSQYLSSACMLNWLDGIQAWKSLSLMMCLMITVNSKFSFKGIFYHNISHNSLLYVAWLQEETEAVPMKLEQDLNKVGVPHTVRGQLNGGSCPPRYGVLREIQCPPEACKGLDCCLLESKANGHHWLLHEGGRELEGVGRVCAFLTPAQYSMPDEPEGTSVTQEEFLKVWTGNFVFSQDRHDL